MATAHTITLVEWIKIWLATSQDLWKAISVTGELDHFLIVGDHNMAIVEAEASENLVDAAALKAALVFRVKRYILNQL